MYLECANDSNIEYGSGIEMNRGTDLKDHIFTEGRAADHDVDTYSANAQIDRPPLSAANEVDQFAKELDPQPCDLKSIQQQLPKLPSTARQQAADFVLEYGTNLQRERLLYHFSLRETLGQAKVSNQNVLAALSHYQNEDGGFGHGLEADLRTKQSSVIATTIAIQILESVDALDSELADSALQYLITHFQSNGWNAIHSGCNDAPHAPWWKYEVYSSSFQANPTVEIIKFLASRKAMTTECAALIDTAMEYLKTQAIDMHELLCYTRLYESEALNKAERLAMLPHLLSHGYRLVNVESKDWEEYCLTPLSVVTHPHSIFAEFFADTLEENFQFLLDSQNSDGSWSPNWSWAGEYPASWKVVSTEIKAELTLQTLMQFDSFGTCSP